jgi:HK97 gp10 family phage protein
MAKNGIEWDDAKFQAALKRTLKRFEVKVEGDLVTLGIVVQNEARKLCPVDTGRLRSSIMSSGLQRDGKGAYVRIGTNVHYAGHVEFGTRFMAAQPYMRPALLAGLQRFSK